MTSAAIPNVLEIINSGDPISLLFLIFVCYHIGKAMVLTKARLRMIGIRVSAAAFVLYLIYGWITEGSSDPGVLLSLVWRGALLYGLTLGFTWILLAVLHYCLNLANHWLQLLRSFVARFVYFCLWPKRFIQREVTARRNQREYARSAPERERQRRLALQQEKKAACLKSLRSEKSYEAQLLFNRLQATSHPVFERDEFEKMLEHALKPNNAAVISDRIAMLLEALQVADTASEQAPQQTIEDIARQFNERRQAIENCDGYSASKKQDLLLWLNREEGHAVEQLLRRNR